ncbi:F-box only protein 39-like isoform X1 [Notolabrus celidotus]|uniref:F-box only protein 39-like isoform X1 n=1 Tax=Notolabrus celidotus TaxID=1203425 RepID=UPI001490357F|nr:F-box only protein 39-like isoform X1 [Notolabrus celidotus]
MDTKFNPLQSYSEEEYYADISDLSDDYQRNSSAGGWGSLPDLCLHNVFVFLEDQDRRSADLACRHWHHVMRSPSLWRFHIFNFSGRQGKYMQSEYYSAMAYASSLGSYLETMEVCVVPPRKSYVAHRLEQAISGLLSELTRVRAPIRSISITRLDLDRTSWKKSLRNSLVKRVTDFLQRGDARITSVSLNGMRNHLAHGLDLLSALTNSQRRSSPRGFISSLDLRGFFSSSVHVNTNPQVPYILSQLKGLTDLSLSYSYLSDEVLTALQHRPQGQRRHPSRDGNPLERLALHCSCYEYHRQLVSGSSWTNLVSTCPKLKVMLTVNHIVNTNWLARILVPEIPLTEFDMTVLYPTGSPWSVRPILHNLLPQYRRSLQRLNIDLSNGNEPLNEELLELVKQCECLEDLRVWAFLDISTVERLLHIRLTKRSLLNKIRLGIYSSDEYEEQKAQLEQITSSYLQLHPELDLYVMICPFV